MIMKPTTLLFKILTIILFCIIVIFLVIVNILSQRPISKDKMEKEFLRHKDVMKRVEKYLEEQEYSYICIWATQRRDEMYVQKKDEKLGETIQILDNTIVNDISNLFDKYNYQIIEKEENEIYFQRWSNLKYGRGVVYMINGDKPENELLTIFEPLSENNWYFYEEK